MFYRHSILHFRNLVQIRFVSIGWATYPQESSSEMFEKNESVSWENVIVSLTAVSLMVYCNFGNPSVEA